MRASVAKLTRRWAGAFDRKLKQLAFVKEDVWPDGQVITFLKSPFPMYAGRYPHVSHREIASALRDPKSTETVSLKSIRSSQGEVTDVGVKKYQNGPDKLLPILIALSDGTYAIQDGHHRLTALWLQGKASTSATVVRNYG